MEYKIIADPDQLKTWVALKKKIRSRAPKKPEAGCRQSRRVQGMMDYNRWARGHSQVFVYIQKGLGPHTDEISKIIKAIYSLQGSDTKFRLYLAAFGAPELTVHPRPYNTYRFKRKIRATVENLAGESPITPCLLNTLDMKPYLKAGRYQKINTRDLVIIFADNLENMRLSETVMEKLLKQKNSYIVVVGEEEIKGKLLRKRNFEQEEQV